MTVTRYKLIKPEGRDAVWVNLTTQEESAEIPAIDSSGRPMAVPTDRYPLGTVVTADDQNHILSVRQPTPVV